ncbi:hypothetical protein [Enterobacter cloacae complex sp. ESBL7]|uniref:hypothetical protein n=1 Tax=Enterobacter cloacae complex sp. ESBL7 TaxID=3163325 RepID=UPI0035617EE1
MSAGLKKKLSIFALSVVGSVSMQQAIADGISPVFTTTVSVHSSNECGIAVTSPGDTDFSAAWTYSAASGSSISNTSKLTDPREILVSATGGGTCKITKLSLSTEWGNEGVVSGGTYRAQALVPFGSSGGFWATSIQLASIKAFSDANASTQLATPVTFTRSDGADLDLATSATGFGSRKVAAGSTVSNGAAYPIPMLALTDMYLNAVHAALGGVVEFTSETDSVKAVKLGIGSMVAKDPQNSLGTAAPLVAESGDEVKLPVTVNVSLA